MQTETKLETVQAVDRAFQILELLSERRSMSLSELHKEVKVNKASLLRLAYTLVQNGYLDKHPETGNYSLTTKAYEIGIRSIQNIDKFSLINSVLAELGAKTGRIAQFSIEDHDELLCLQSIGQKTSTFSVYTNVGNRSPLYCTSAGKAILAAYTNSQIMERWDSFGVKQLTEHTITNVHRLLEDLSQVRQRRYAVDREENEYNVFCVGAAVLGSANVPVGAVSISGRSLTAAEEEQISEALLPAVKLLSGYMGYMEFH